MLGGGAVVSLRIFLKLIWKLQPEKKCQNGKNLKNFEMKEMTVWHLLEIDL